MTRAIVVIEGDLADIRRIRRFANGYPTSSAVWQEGRPNFGMPGLADGYARIWHPVRDSIESAKMIVAAMRRD